MKRLLKIGFVIAVMLMATNSFAQKFARIDTNQLIAAMPERDSAAKQIEAYLNESREAYETMNVEFNNKLNDYDKKKATLTDAMKTQKEKELQELSQRLQGYYEVVQQGQQELQQKLYAPIQEKALKAIRKVGKDNGYASVMEGGVMLYADDAQITDILPLVKKELGLK